MGLFNFGKKKENHNIDIALRDIINIKELLTNYNIDKFEFVTCSIGNDHQIYLLYSSKIPSRIEEGIGSFVPTTSGSFYKAIVLAVDWEYGELINHKIIDFGKIASNVHFIQPIENNYLLLGARARLYKDGTTDKNANIIDKSGKIIKSMCLGDGVQDCMVDYENHIVISYFDEGIFGNYGWDEPLGAHGIVRWSSSGAKLWEDGQYGICDCYAMNIDDRNRLWFYYYTEFDLIQTDYKRDVVFSPQISGANSFLLKKDYTSVLFDKGYNNHGKFCVKNFKGEKMLSDSTDCIFVYDNNQISGFSNFRGSKAIFIDNKKMLYYVDWID